MSFVRELNRFHTEARSKNSVERGRRAATLQMSEDAGARFFSSAFGDLMRDNVANSAQFEFAGLHVSFDLLAILWSRAFRDHHKRIEPASRVPFLDRVRD